MEAKEYFDTVSMRSVCEGYLCRRTRHEPPADFGYTYSHGFYGFDEDNAMFLMEPGSDGTLAKNYIKVEAQKFHFRFQFQVRVSENGINFYFNLQTNST